MAPRVSDTCRALLALAETDIAAFGTAAFAPLPNI